MDDQISRAERREQSRSRSRVWIAVGGGVLVVIAIAVGALLLGGADDSTSADGKATSHPAANTSITIAAGDVTADSAGGPVTVTPEIAAAVLDTLRNYVEVATVEPLRSAQPAGDLSAVFDTAALARATGVDRAALVDEGLPKVTGNLDVVAQPVAITGLGDQDGKLVLVTTTIDLDATGVVPAKKTASSKTKVPPVHVKRAGSFVFTPDASGAWKVSAYTITVGREGGTIDATTTTAAGASK
jgi:hypothetical protein